MTKESLIELLEESAAILELKGESPFKSRAYANAARVLAQLEIDLSEAVQSQALLEYKGIGKSIFEKISEGIRTGRVAFYEELKSSTPPGLLEMLHIKGLGPKKIRTIYEKLGIKDLVELEYACIENRLVDLPGFGQKTQDKIREGISYYKKHKNFFHFHTAWQEANALLAQLRLQEGVVRADIAGDLRRRNEIVRDIQIVVSCGDAPALLDASRSFPQVEKEISRTENAGRMMLKSGIEAALYAVSDDQFSSVLHYHTGGPAYRDALSKRAERFGIRLSEYGLFLDDHLLPCQDEQDIFSTLELDYIEPELREGSGEIEAAGKRILPRLVEEKDLRGIFHVHSTYSDGSASLSQMIEAAERLGYEYIGLSDHSQSAFYANGLKKEQIMRQHEEIAQLREKFRNIHIFKGVEADILPDGTLDYDDETLASFDFVIASVHSVFNMSEKEMTRRVIRAMSHPCVTFLGHPTGRILLSREGYPLCVPEVIEAARHHGVAIELNASPYRLDLDWRYCRLATKAGVRLSIHPDAHSVNGLSDTYYGVGIARKGWLSADDLINTLPLSKIQSYLKEKKYGNTSSR